MFKLLVSKGWITFLSVTVALGLAGGGYAAWTSALHVEGQVATGSVDAVWDMQEERLLIEEFDPNTGGTIIRPLLPEEEEAIFCVSDLDPGEQASTVHFDFLVDNGHPKVICELTLGGLITGTIPVILSDIQIAATDVDGNDVLGADIVITVELMRKFFDGAGFFCDPNQPVGVGTQLHQDDRICAITSIKITDLAGMNSSYQGNVDFELVQWNLAGAPPAP